jgi:outer membrane protein assembly factor BamD
VPRLAPRAFRTGLALCGIALLALAACSRSPHYSHLPEAVLYRRAYNNLIAANYATATVQLNSLRATYPYGHYARQAALDLVFARLMESDVRRAAHEAQRFIHANPRSRYIPYALYMEGIAYSQGRGGPVANFLNPHPSDRNSHGLRRAFAAFRALLKRDPHSRYAPDARQRMIAVRNALARHQFLVADFYARKKAWVGAARRLVRLLDRYPDTATTPRALALLQRCYGRLGEHALAARIGRVRAALATSPAHGSASHETAVEPPPPPSRP